MPGELGRVQTSSQKRQEASSRPGRGVAGCRLSPRAPSHLEAVLKLTPRKESLEMGATPLPVLGTQLPLWGVAGEARHGPTRGTHCL